MNIDRYLAAEQRLFADAGIAPAQRWLRLSSGPRVRVLEHGTGTPVLFLHGGPNAAATWAYVVAALGDMRCLLLDRPGCGLSEPLPTIPDVSALPQYVGSLTAEVLDELDIQRAVVVGSSFGGYSALRTAIDHPGRVAAIVLAGCPAFVPGWKAPSFFTVLRTPGVGRLLLAAPATKAAVKMSLRQMGHARTVAEGAIGLPMLEWMLAWQRDTPTMRNDAAMIVRCGTWRGGFAPSLDLTRDELARVDVPTHLMFGTHDPVGGRHVADAVAALLPIAAVDCLDGAGHLPWLDDPNWLAASIETTAAQAV